MRFRPLPVLLAVTASGACVFAQPRKVTYEDDVVPIFRDNCLKCHNPDKLKGDLDLSSFSGTIKGGGGGSTVNSGDPEGSQLFKSITHSEEPTMPPNAKLSAKDIATIRLWIEGGLLQGVNSKAIAASKPAVDLALKSTSTTRPEGPPPMPGTLPIDPFVRGVHATALGALAHSPWAPVAALGGAKQVALYHSTTLELLGFLPFPEGQVCDLKFSRNGKLLVAGGGRGGHSGVVAVWDISTGQRVITIGDQFDSVTAADLSPDQQWIALGGPDRVLKIYRTQDGSLQHRIRKHTEWVTAVEFSPDGKYLVSGDRNGGMVLWEAESGQEMFTVPGHKGAITAVSWRDDSAMWASASEDGTVKLWKSADASALRSITAHPGGALSARFTHDGRLATAGRDNKFQVWDTSGKNLQTLPFSGDLPHRVAFSDDGRRLVGSDWQGKVLVWDAKPARLAGELDSNPPPLAERVQRASKALPALVAEAKKAEAQLQSAEIDAQVAQVRVEGLKQRLTELKAKPAAADAKPGEQKARLAALEKEIAAATTQATKADQAAREAKEKAESLVARVKLTQATVEKGQAQLRASAGPRQVSSR